MPATCNEGASGVVGGRAIWGGILKDEGGSDRLARIESLLVMSGMCMLEVKLILLV